MDYLYEITIPELAGLIKSKKLSIKEVVSEYLSHIEKYDKGESGFHSIMELNPDAISIAEELDRREATSILHGIPILVKGNINTGDKMHTNGGSLALANHIAEKDAEIIKRLRNQGAIILGKTNLTELSNSMTEGMPAGYSSVSGQILSPYKRGEDPSGSSTGSAVAVTANFAPAALGTDTSGSVVSPSIRNSLVGFRPSSHSLSRQGIIPYSFTLDTVGAMARSVSDCALIHGAMCEGNPKLKSRSLQGLKIGVPKADLKKTKREESAKIDEILKRLEGEGAIIKFINMENIEKDKIGTSISTIQKYELKYAMNKYLKTLPKDYPIKTLKDIIEFNEVNKEKALKYGQIKLIESEGTKGDLSEEEYMNVLKDREKKKKIAAEYFKDADVILDLKNSQISQYTGLPSITIPYGLDSNQMPYGIAFIGLQDETLLNAAYSIEQVIGHRAVPELKVGF